MELFAIAIVVVFFIGADGWRTYMHARSFGRMKHRAEEVRSLRPSGFYGEHRDDG